MIDIGPHAGQSDVSIRGIPLDRQQFTTAVDAQAQMFDSDEPRDLRPCKGVPNVEMAVSQ